MESVSVIINRDNVLSDMKVKSHAEVAIIGDPTERYLAELGTEKEEEAHQCITDASSEIYAQLRPFLFGGVSVESINDDYDTSDIAFVLSVTARKASGLAEGLAKAIHAYIVDSALDKFYTSVSRPELSERHRVKLPAELAVIENLMYRRTNPTYTFA